MSKIQMLIRIAVSGALAASALSASTPVLADEHAGMEQCAGIVKAGKNDCATSSNECHSHVTTDANPEAWVYLPNGTCERLVGGRVVAARDPSPKKASNKG